LLYAFVPTTRNRMSQKKEWRHNRVEVNSKINMRVSCSAADITSVFYLHGDNHNGDYLPWRDWTSASCTCMNWKGRAPVLKCWGLYEYSRDSGCLKVGRLSGWSSSPGKSTVFLTFTTSRQVLGPTHLIVQWAPGALSPWGKRSARKAYHWPLNIVEVKNAFLSHKSSWRNA
jgi:hypothetical protein